MPLAPYVVGQWVRGSTFYGRAALLQEILHGHRNCVWLLGTRRIGKTSILKQLELLTSQTPELGFFPLFWDFQGAEEPDDLHESFEESLLDAFDRLDELGIDPDRVEADDLFSSLSRLRRELRSRDRALLLLGDEVEELVTIHAKQPRFLRRLRRAMQSAENIRTVLASKIKLWELADEETSTSPFLHGFTPPLFVYGLEDEEARGLVRQDQLPADARPQLSEAVVEEIRSRCSNHPYLMQVLGERFSELGNLADAVEQIANDPMVSHFFSVDFEMLTESERDVIRLIGTGREVSSASIRQGLALDDVRLRGVLLRLEHLGFISRVKGGGFVLANSFFKRWFSELPTLQRMRREDHEPTLRPATASPAPSSRTSRRVSDRYELDESLGRGATGEVFRARDTLLNTTIAVKVLNPEYCAEPDSLERLRREVLLSRDLVHRNILKIYHLGEDHDVRYVTMQYVAGSDLAQTIRQSGAMPLGRAVSIAGQVASALAAAHRASVLHRDIKPQNILIDEEGMPHISDFGLARLVGGPTVTRDGAFIGTPAYASPEQVRGRSLDARSDLYSLGVVLFEMVTGERPFASTLAREVLLMHLNQPPPPPQSLRPDLPDALSTVVLRLLEKDPARRYQSSEELVRALRQVFADRTSDRSVVFDPERT